MDHSVSVLNHYVDLMDILGKKKDYTAIGNFLSGQAQILKNELEVTKTNYEMLQQ
jgi:hypothetical protein